MYQILNQLKPNELVVNLNKSKNSQDSLEVLHKNLLELMMGHDDQRWKDIEEQGFYAQDPVHRINCDSKTILDFYI